MNTLVTLEIRCSPEAYDALTNGERLDVFCSIRELIVGVLNKISISESLDKELYRLSNVTIDDIGGGWDPYRSVVPKSISVHVWIPVGDMFSRNELYRGKLDNGIKAINGNIADRCGSMRELNKPEIHEITVLISPLYGAYAARMFVKRE